eukprot:c3042_g1_i1.p1 GENE.c3042_g1_i1~~c3042_g1_i1.p1  ORF type:complete len:329 (+),score=57.09 c3042_g1_i1:25-1011(+)
MTPTCDNPQNVPSTLSHHFFAPIVYFLFLIVIVRLRTCFSRNRDAPQKPARNPAVRCLDVGKLLIGELAAVSVDQNVKSELGKDPSDLYDRLAWFCAIILLTELIALPFSIILIRAFSSISRMLTTHSTTPITAINLVRRVRGQIANDPCHHHHPFHPHILLQPLHRLGCYHPVSNPTLVSTQTDLQFLNPSESNTPELISGMSKQKVWWWVTQTGVWCGTLVLCRFVVLWLLVDRINAFNPLANPFFSTSSSCLTRQWVFFAIHVTMLLLYATIVDFFTKYTPSNATPSVIRLQTIDQWQIHSDSTLGSQSEDEDFEQVHPDPGMVF